MTTTTWVVKANFLGGFKGKRDPGWPRPQTRAELAEATLDGNSRTELVATVEAESRAEAIEGAQALLVWHGACRGLRHPLIRAATVADNVVTDPHEILRALGVNPTKAGRVGGLRRLRFRLDHRLSRLARRPQPVRTFYDYAPKW